VSCALCQPEMLVVSPRGIVPFSAEAPAAPGAAVLGWAPGIELETGAVLRTHPTVRRQYRLGFRDRWHAVEYRLGALGEAAEQPRQVTTRGNLCPPDFQLVGGQHR
jgi:hypothetical protein